MDDNCRPQHANLVEDLLFEEGILRMEWPVCSPDMNPIEHIWDALERRVAGCQPPPQTLQALERALLEKWDRIPQLVINSLIDSMPQRARFCLPLQSGPSKPVLRMSFLDESIRNVGERDSRKPFPHFLRQQHHSLLVSDVIKWCRNNIRHNVMLVVKKSWLPCHAFMSSATEKPPCKGTDAH
ncbi:transposable element Tcb2 transposase [Trichonephila clavipes]|nr:transposable element Tcb2 transposase [Trichonephila clavipes]